MSKKLAGGLLIVFEGIDGVGKTTQLELVKAELGSEGWPIHSSRNLGGTAIGDELRKIILSSLPRPETANLYISAAIQEALTESISSEREAGKLILLDRGPLSLAAYEINGGRLAGDLVWPHVDEGMTRLKPDLVIVYAAEVPIALSRLKKQGEKADYFESKGSDYFYRVAEGYAQAARRYSDICVVINADQPIDKIHQETMSAIRQEITAKSA